MPKQLPQWIQNIREKTVLKIDTEEEYIKKSTDSEYYDFCQFMDDCITVYGVNPIDTRYGDKRLLKRPYYGSAGVIDHLLTEGIERRGLDPNAVPLIPIMEYKLVPTGYIEYYDARLTPVQRKNRRYKRTANGQQHLQDQNIKRRKKNKENEKNP